jgi:endonuclease/exonuclease/phosphatase family metal-dependent hydrolase
MKWAIFAGWMLAASLSHAICIQTFNTYGPMYAPNITSRSEALSKEILSAPCDIVHFQEVWNSGQQNVLVSNLQPAFNISAPNMDLKIGLMALTKGQITYTDVYTFVMNSDSFMDSLKDVLGVKKGFMNMVVQLPGLNTPVLATNVHTHPMSGSVRLAQVLDIYQWRLRNLDYPWVITGDFNFTADSFEWKFFKALLGVHDVQEETVGYNGQCTFCGTQNPLSDEKGNWILDYIFVSNITKGMNWKWQLEGSEINLRGGQRSPLSDHYGLRAQVKLQQGTPATDWKTIPERAKAVQNMIATAHKHLQAAGNSDYDYYIELLEKMSAQIDRQYGPVWDYLIQYN